MWAGVPLRPCPRSGGAVASRGVPGLGGGKRREGVRRLTTWRGIPGGGMHSPLHRVLPGCGARAQSGQRCGLCSLSCDHSGHGCGLCSLSCALSGQRCGLCSLSCVQSGQRCGLCSLSWACLVLCVGCFGGTVHYVCIEYHI